VDSNEEKDRFTFPLKSIHIT